MKIYVIIKAALQANGEFTKVQTEKAFSDKQKAEDYFKVQKNTWVENENGVTFLCERAIHEVEME